MKKPTPGGRGIGAHGAHGARGAGVHAAPAEPVLTEAG